MCDFITKLGRICSVSLITAVAIISSILLTVVFMEIFLIEHKGIGMIIAVLVPLIIAPFVSWPVIGLVIRIHNLEQEQRSLATYDSLTGVLTRRFFMQIGQATLELAVRNQSPLALASIDIDDFKSINDVYGHAVGDEVLRLCATKIMASIRESDISGRLGGDEFLIILSGVSKRNATKVLKKILDTTSNSTLERAGASVRCTLSVGVALFDGKGKVGLEELMHQSDLALYEAKRTGKNKVVEYRSLDVIASCD